MHLVCVYGSNGFMLVIESSCSFHTQYVLLYQRTIHLLNKVLLRVNEKLTFNIQFYGCTMYIPTNYQNLSLVHFHTKM